MTVHGISRVLLARSLPLHAPPLAVHPRRGPFVAKYDAREIRALYDRGENITRWIQAHEGADSNSVTAILYSYDAQAGSYVDALKEPAARALKQDLGRELGALLDKLAPSSLLEAGIGEGTSLAPILNHMSKPPAHVLGFDLSLSRLLFARRHLAENGFENVKLFTGDLDRIPLASESVDVVLDNTCSRAQSRARGGHSLRAFARRSKASGHDRTKLRTCFRRGARANGSARLCARIAGNA